MLHYRTTMVVIYCQNIVVIETKPTHSAFLMKCWSESVPLCPASDFLPEKNTLWTHAFRYNGRWKWGKV